MLRLQHASVRRGQKTGKWARPSAAKPATNAALVPPCHQKGPVHHACRQSPPSPMIVDGFGGCCLMDAGVPMKPVAGIAVRSDQGTATTVLPC
jgi:hypothetical protein